MRHDAERTEFRVDQSWVEDVTKHPQTMGSLVATVTCQLTLEFSPCFPTALRKNPGLTKVA